jgi:putative DNA primase/helicase
MTMSESSSATASTPAENPRTEPLDPLYERQIRLGMFDDFWFDKPRWGLFRNGTGGLKGLRLTINTDTGESDPSAHRFTFYEALAESRRVVCDGILIRLSSNENFGVEFEGDDRAINSVGYRLSTCGTFDNGMKWRDYAARSPIELTTDEFNVNRQVAEALTDDPNIYVRGGSLCMVCEIDGRAEIRPIMRGLLRDRIAGNVCFYVINPTSGNLNYKHPPDWCVSAMYDRLDWSEMRRLNGIITTPSVRPNGSLLDKPGWDYRTGLLFLPRGPQPIIGTDAEAARDQLLDVVCDVPFALPVHRATWLAELLTQVGRPTFDGPSPAFAHDAPAAGTGKTLLADVNFGIAYGTPAHRYPCPETDDEMRKRITALAMKGVPAVLLDNVSGLFGTPALDAALTTTSWGDRVLGRNQDVQLPLHIVWIVTGNNLTVRPDTSRRIAHIRLEAKVEDPETRTGFKYPDLLGYVREHRPELLGAALCILRSWFSAGCPRQELLSWGSFEAWSSVIRQVIVWLGLPDPAGSREEFRASADRERGSLQQVITLLATMDPKAEGQRASEIVKKAEKDPELQSALAEFCEVEGHRLTARLLGTRLAHARGRIIEGKYLDEQKQRGGFKAWLVRSAK